MSSGVSHAHPGDQGVRGGRPANEEFDLGIEADDKADGNKEAAKEAVDEPKADPGEIELLKSILKKVPPSYLSSSVPKSGDKWGSSHLDGGSGSSDSSPEDLDANQTARSKKKTETPTKASSHPNKWSEVDIDVVCQFHHKTDFKHFQTYRTNKITPADISTINTTDHSTYIAVVCADPGSVV